MVTNLYQVEKHRMYMQMESDKLHKHFYQVLKQLCNDSFKNSISSSRFGVFCSNWVPRKLMMIPRRVYVFMLHIFYVFNVIMAIGNFGIYCHLLFFVSLLVRNQLKPRRNDTIDLLTLGHFCVPKIYPNVNFKGCFK